MMTPLVLTQPIVEKETLLTHMGTHGLKIRTTETVMVDKEALNSKETLRNTSKVIEAGLWISCLPSKGS
jgi:hypothetical protein